MLRLHFFHTFFFNKTIKCTYNLKYKFNMVFNFLINIKDSLCMLKLTCK